MALRRRLLGAVESASTLSERRGLLFHSSNCSPASRTCGPTISAVRKRSESGSAYDNTHGSATEFDATNEAIEGILGPPEEDAAPQTRNRKPQTPRILRLPTETGIPKRYRVARDTQEASTSLDDRVAQETPVPVQDGVDVKAVGSKRRLRRLEVARRLRAAQAAATIVNDEVTKEAPASVQDGVDVIVAGRKHRFPSLLLRDMCECPRCVDVSTKQKSFSTTDIPHDVKGAVINLDGRAGFVQIGWDNDIAGYGSDHTSTFRLDDLAQIANGETVPVTSAFPRRVFWSAEQQKADVLDVDCDAYMFDDAVLHQALLKLHTHGLLFLTSVPELETSVASICERIGPLKNTFYGSTWDVRSVPQAKNVAYTSQDLGFHMDLMYMRQPPHLQFLHCIRSSSAGGASLFTDSFRAARDLFRQDYEACKTLGKTKVGFHYNHPESHYYHQSRTVLDTGIWWHSEAFRTAKKAGLYDDVTAGDTRDDIEDRLRTVSWAPQFQAPFASFRANHIQRSKTGPLRSSRISDWHQAASVFNELIHKPEGIYERMMKPGECVIFDNRRVLHARKAFEVGDAGKERWLRGAYLDQDPYDSKLRVLERRFGVARSG